MPYKSVTKKRLILNLILAISVLLIPMATNTKAATAIEEAVVEKVQENISSTEELEILDLGPVDPSPEEIQTTTTEVQTLESAENLNLESATSTINQELDITSDGLITIGNATTSDILPGLSCLASCDSSLNFASSTELGQIIIETVNGGTSTPPLIDLNFASSTGFEQTLEQTIVETVSESTNTPALIVFDPFATTTATTTVDATENSLPSFIGNFASSTLDILSDTLEALGNVTEVVLEGTFFEELEWTKSYATTGFDTESGDLEPGDYTLSENETDYLYRDPKSDPSKDQFSSTSASSTVIDITKYRRVNIKGSTYYNEFRDRNGIIYREKISEENYKYLGSPDAKQPIKKITVIKNPFAIEEANAVISFDAATLQDCTGQCSSLTYSHTTAANSNRMLIVGVALGTCHNALPTISSITYNSVTLSSVVDAGLDSGVCSANPDRRIAQYKLENPSLGANNVVLTLSSSVSGVSVHSSAATFAGVAQTNPITASGSAGGQSTTASVTVTTRSTDMIVDEVCDGNTVTSAGADQTSRGINNNSANTSCDNDGVSTQSGGAGGVMTWTVGNDLWAISALSLQAFEENNDSSFWWNFVKKITPKVFASPF